MVVLDMVTLPVKWMFWGEAEPPMVPLMAAAPEIVPWPWRKAPDWRVSGPASVPLLRRRVPPELMVVPAAAPASAEAPEILRVAFCWTVIELAPVAEPEEFAAMRVPDCTLVASE